MSETVKWCDVHEGDVLQGKDGNAWTVAEIEDARTFVLEQRGGTATFTAKVSPEATVVRLESGLPSSLPGHTEEQVAEVAEAIVGLHLGGEVVAHQREGSDDWYVPNSGWTPASLHAHLTMFHGLGPADRPEQFRELEQFHERDHAGWNGDRKNYLIHHHTDEPFKRGGRTSW